MAMLALLLVWVSVVSWFDLRQRRVPNAALVLVLTPGLLALLIQERGLLGSSVAASLAGLVTALLLTLPGYWLRRLGAGDVKFAACLGLLLGFARGVEMLLIAFLLMGLAAVVMTVRGLPRGARFAAAPSFALGFVVEMFAGPLLPVWHSGTR